MFVPSAEALLMGGVVALYLYDSTILLHCNEAVMYPVGRTGWALRFGSHRFQWRGREVFLPDPSTPHRPLYRLLWSYDMPSNEAVKRVPEWLRGDWKLTGAIWAMVFALGLLLPLGLFSRWGDLMIVAALAVFYASAVMALSLIWRRRLKLALGRNQFLRLAFECLTCPPFALNLIRHVSLLTQPPVDLVTTACGLQDAKAWEETRSRLMDRLQEELQWLGSADPEVVAVNAELMRLASLRRSEGGPVQDRKGSPW